MLNRLIITGKKEEDRVSLKGVQFTLDLSLGFPYLGLLENFPCLVEEILLYLHGVCNITKTSDYYKTLHNYALNDDDLNTFIERIMMGDSKEPIPLDVLKHIKKGLIDGEALGSMGVSEGQMIRFMTHPSFNIYTPIAPLKDVAQDTRAKIEAEFEKLKKDDPLIGENKITFEQAYPKIGIKYIDQFQTLMNNLKYKNYARLCLSHYHPIYEPIASLSEKDNIWVNRAAFYPSVVHQQYIVEDNTIHLVITLTEISVSSSLFHFIGFYALLLSTIASLHQLVPGEIIWNIGKAYLLKKDQSIIDLSKQEYLSNRNGILPKLTIQSKKTFLDLDVNDFTLLEI
jgi:thymidylate synthase